MSIAAFFAAGMALLGLIAAEPLHAEKPCPTSLMLYYSSSCWHSKKVLEYLEENHLHLPMKDVGIDKAAKEELRVKGGQMIVPCLIIDDRPLYDDDTIIQWIKDNRTCLGGP